jgi:hypothetical protein
MQTPTAPTPETMSQPTDDASTRWTNDGSWVTTPIDNPTYDLLMALTSKLEAIDTYRKYAGDGDAQLWRDLATDEGRHAERLLTELKRRLTA